MPNLKFSFADAHVKMREGGWSREVTQRELPIATALAGVNLRLTSGGVYASCIGTSRLSGHSYWQERRVSPPSTMTDIIADVSPGDLWCFGIDFAKRSVAHVFLGSAECVSTCQPSHAVALCRSPDRASRKLDNCCRRLSGIFGLKFRKWEDGAFLKITEARCWRVLSAVEKIFPQTAECLAGAAGIEPPNGGIKIRQSPLILIAFLPPCCICVAFRTSGLCRDDPIGSGNSEKRI
jgi:hypothetical protein